MNGQSSVYFKGFDELFKYEGDGADDLLSQLMEGQHELMELMQYGRFPSDIYFMLTANNLVKEALEASEFFGDITKPWKENYNVDFAHIKEEWIDILFFWLQGAIALGMTTDEVFFSYFRKLIKNKERIKAKLNENQ